MPWHGHGFAGGLAVGLVGCFLGPERRSRGLTGWSEGGFVPEVGALGWFSPTAISTSGMSTRGDARMGTVRYVGVGMGTVRMVCLPRQCDTDTSENDHSVDGRMVRGVSGGWSDGLGRMVA